jgi:hypothetical protein
MRSVQSTYQNLVVACPVKQDAVGGQVRCTGIGPVPAVFQARGCGTAMLHASSAGPQAPWVRWCRALSVMASGLHGLTARAAEAAGPVATW